MASLNITCVDGLGNPVNCLVDPVPAVRRGFEKSVTDSRPGVSAERRSKKGLSAPSPPASANAGVPSQSSSQASKREAGTGSQTSQKTQKTADSGPDSSATAVSGPDSSASHKGKGRVPNPPGAKKKSSVAQQMDKIVVLQLNVNGLKARAAELAIILTRYDVDVALLQETRMSKEATVSFSGYSVYQCKCAKNCQGLATLIRNDCVATVQNCASSSRTDVQQIQIHKRGLLYTVFNVYCPPKVKLDIGLRGERFVRTMVAGDLNARSTLVGYPHDSGNKAGEVLEDIVGNTNLVLWQNADTPATCFQNQGGTPSRPDLTLMSADIVDRSLTRVLPDAGSDHLPLLTTITLHSAKQTQKPRRSWIYGRANWAKYEELVGPALEQLPSDRNISTMYQGITSAILEAAKKAIPRSTTKRFYRIPRESQWRDEVAPAAVTPIDNLFCMAHVLLGFHSYCIKALKEHQKTVSQTGVLGRDLHPGFKRYKCDAAAERLCSTASDVFAPVGNHLGARDIWEAYCLEHGIKSEIKNYKDNRFNGLFQVSAAVTYHRDDFHKILSQIKDPNKKLQALKADLEDSNLTNIIHTLGILYVKITGPFWNLIQSTSHSKLKPILKQLRSDIQEIEKNPALISTELPSLAGFALVTPLRKIVPDKLTKELDIILQCLCKAFLSTMDKQLHDIFEESEESVSATSNAAFAPSTNLICEHHFGDLDSSQRRRPGASMHHHSSVQMLKRNRKGMSKWLCSMPSAERTAVLKSARSSSQTLRKKHQKQYYSELSKSSLKLSASRSTAKALLKKAVRGNKKTQQLTLPDTSTVKVNQWVIAAYQDNWYPGIIRAVDVTNFTIDFARRCNKVGNFQWPNGGDIQSVEKHFIISTNVDIFTATKGRVWSIRGVDKIEKVFRQFVKKYFN